MPKQVAHLTVNGLPYCDRLGCVAGMDTARKSGVDSCDFASMAAARRAAKALRPFFCVPVRVVAGYCTAA